jgi:hypothetical protein
LIFVRQPWWRGWLVALAAGGVLLIALFVHPPLWLGTLLAIGIFAGLIWSYRSSPGVSASRRPPELMAK